MFKYVHGYIISKVDDFFFDDFCFFKHKKMQIGHKSNRKVLVYLVLNKYWTYIKGVFKGFSIRSTPIFGGLFLCLFLFFGANVSAGNLLEVFKITGGDFEAKKQLRYVINTTITDMEDMFKYKFPIKDKVYIYIENAVGSNQKILKLVIDNFVQTYIQEKDPLKNREKLMRFLIPLYLYQVFKDKRKIRFAEIYFIIPDWMMEGIIFRRMYKEENRFVLGRKLLYSRNWENLNDLINLRFKKLDNDFSLQSSLFLDFLLKSKNEVIFNNYIKFWLGQIPSLPRSEYKKDFEFREFVKSYGGTYLPELKWDKDEFLIHFLNAISMNTVLIAKLVDNTEQLVGDLSDLTKVKDEQIRKMLILETKVVLLNIRLRCPYECIDLVDDCFQYLSLLQENEKQQARHFLKIFLNKIQIVLEDKE